MRIQVFAAAVVAIVGTCASEPLAQETEDQIPQTGSGQTQSVEADLIGATHEIAALRELLRAWADRPDWPQDLRPAQTFSERLDGNPCPAISSRLALFRSRFGMDFRDAPGWSDVSGLAKEVYDRLVAEYPAPEPAEIPFAHTWLQPGWLTVRALLLDIAGDSEAARSLLFGDVTRFWDGGNPMDHSQDLFYLSGARAGFEDRRGNSNAALLWYHDAFYNCERDDVAEVFGRTRPARDLLLARYAILLADAGELEAAASIVRVLDADQPEPFGRSVVRSILGERLAGAAESEVFTVLNPPIAISRNWSATEAWAFIEGDRDDPTTWRVLACGVPRWPERKTGRYMPDYRTDYVIVEPTDPRVAHINWPSLGGQ